MTTGHLRSTLETRAARAEEIPADPEDMLQAVRDRVARTARRRRNAVAAGGGAALAAAVAVSVVLIVPQRRPSHEQLAGGPPRSTASTALSGPATPTITPTPRLTTPNPFTAKTSKRLVRVVTPRTTPVALGLTREGWVYLGSQDNTAVYGARGGDPQAWSGKIAVVVSKRETPRTYPTRIAGRPAAIDVSDRTSATVHVRYNATIEIDIQVSAAAGLNIDTIRTMANTLIIRDVSHVAVG